MPGTQRRRDHQEFVMRVRDWFWVLLVGLFVAFSLGALSYQVERRQDFREWCASEGGHSNRKATECRSDDGEIILRRS